jgi:hypothetical protein
MVSNSKIDSDMSQTFTNVESDDESNNDSVSDADKESDSDEEEQNDESDSEEEQDMEEREDEQWSGLNQNNSYLTQVNLVSAQIYNKLMEILH